MKTSHPLALITGGARRIGKAFAQHLASKGWNLAIHYNNSAQEAVALISELSGNYLSQQFMVVKADLAIEEEVATLFPQVIAKMGEPDLLINNASLFKPSTIAATSSPLLEQTLQVNFKAPFQLMRDFHRLCRQGNIVNLADTRITTNHSGYAAYTLSKKMLWEATKMAALEFGPSIRVNAIAPGFFITAQNHDMLLTADGSLTPRSEKIISHTPQRRFGEPSDLIGTLLWLCDYGASGFVDGIVVPVDGGFSAYSGV